MITGGAFRPFGQAVVVDGGYRVSGRRPLGSGCQHCAWIVGGCRILDGDQPRLGADGTPVMRILFFPAAACEILDTWHSIGLRGTGSHDYAVADLFVPAARSLSFREPPVEPGPLYAMPTIGLFACALAAVPLGIARHAIDILVELAETKIRSLSGRSAQCGSCVMTVRLMTPAGWAAMPPAQRDAVITPAKWKAMTPEQRGAVQGQARAQLAAFSERHRRVNTARDHEAREEVARGARL